MLSKETLKVIKDVVDAREKFGKLLIKLDECLSKDTDNVIGMCTPVTQLQLFHYSSVCSIAEALDELHNIADKNSIELTDECDEFERYNCKLNNVKFRILFDKEEL